jgi:5'-3' exonuclease
VKVHLLDGTYELFRHHFAVPSHVTADGREIAAMRGVLESVLNLLSEVEVTHLAVATDHVIESFRNEMYAGYKTGEGLDPILHSQFHPLESALESMGVVVWPMVEFEADDAMAAGAHLASQDPAVTQVQILTPDKDLGQCVVGTRVVQFDRRKRQMIDHQGVIEKFGVPPESIPDYLGLVGDTADGYPGLPGWGAKSAAAVLARYGHLENIPDHAGQWDVPGLRGAAKLASTLLEGRADAVLFRAIATVDRECVTLPNGVEGLRWLGPRDDFEEVAKTFDGKSIAQRARTLAASKATHAVHTAHVAKVARES